MEYISIEEYTSVDLSDKAIFNKLLDILEQQSDSFNLVHPNTYLKKNEYENESTKSEIALSNHLISSKWVKKWPGTNNGKKVYMRTFSTDKFCIDFFRKLTSFFYLEDQIDISFFNNSDKCLCFTISHEDECFVHNDIIKDLREPKA